MMNILSFFLFIAYTIAIFFIKSYEVLGLVTILNILLMIILKENIKSAVIAILKFMPFIIFTTAINILISGVDYGILIGIRLIFVCNITYIFAKRMTPQKLQYVIEKIFRPIKLLGIDSKEIGIIVCIGVAFIPIMKRELEELKYALKAKGFNPSFFNILKKPNYVLAPLISSILKRIDEMEISLMSKGYDG